MRGRAIVYKLVHNVMSQYSCNHSSLNCHLIIFDHWTFPWAAVTIGWCVMMQTTNLFSIGIRNHRGTAAQEEAEARSSQAGTGQPWGTSHYHFWSTTYADLQLKHWPRQRPASIDILYALMVLHEMGLYQSHAICSVHTICLHIFFRVICLLPQCVYIPTLHVYPAFPMMHG